MATTKARCAYCFQAVTGTKAHEAAGGTCPGSITMAQPAPPPGWRWGSVLAGAYRGGRTSLNNTLAHLVNDDLQKVACGKIDAGRMDDPYAPPTDAPPCPACAARASRL